MKHIPSWMPQNKVEQVVKELRKFGYSRKQALWRANVIDETTGIGEVKEAVKKIITEDANIMKKNLTITPEHITAIQKKRYAKRRKYTGAQQHKDNPFKWTENPPATMIYGKTLEIRAQKTQDHVCDAACQRANHKYKHTFKSNAQIYGLPNGDVLITNKKR